MTALLAVDGFCGAGGASRGLADAGYEVVGYDNWAPAVDTHNANGLKAHLHDLSDASIDDTIPECDLMWLSCPCQPFSAAGDSEGEFDERDGFPWALRIIARRLPSVVIFENVKGLTFAKHHAYFAGILESLRVLGYDIDWCVLNCADLGVPQTRERCFIIGRRDGGPITWPMPTHTDPAGMFTLPWVTFAEAVPSALDRIGVYRRGAGLIERHGERPVVETDRPAPTVHRNTEKDLILTIDYRQTNRAGDPIVCDVTDRPSPTVGTQAENQWLVRAGQDSNATTRTIDMPAPTVLGRKDAGEQSQNSIRLTIPELAKLQGFPDDWVWTGTKTSQARQVGNAVPPIMAQLLAEANRPSARPAKRMEAA